MQCSQPHSPSFKMCSYLCRNSLLAFNLNAFFFFMLSKSLNLSITLYNLLPSLNTALFGSFLALFLILDLFLTFHLLLRTSESLQPKHRNSLLIHDALPHTSVIFTVSEMTLPPNQPSTSRAENRPPVLSTTVPIPRDSHFSLAFYSIFKGKEDKPFTLAVVCPTGSQTSHGWSLTPHCNRVGKNWGKAISQH